MEVEIGKITHYFKLISQEVKKSKRFSTEYISKLILHASSFTVNYLIRPKWSLLKFIFDDDENKTAVEIKQILNYLYYYGYLKNVLITYLDKKKILSMNKDEFAGLLEKIEKLGIEMNEEKTRIVDLTEGETFSFLGFDFRRYKTRKGKWGILTYPRQKARAALLGKVRLCRRNSRLCVRLFYTVCATYLAPERDRRNRYRCRNLDRFRTSAQL